MSGYLIRILCASMVCSLVRAICDRSVVKLLCGVYLAGIVLSPAVELQWELPDLEEIRREAEEIAADGVRDAKEAEAEVIKERCEAYILDEAAALGLQMDVQVTVEEGLPVVVTMTGCPDSRMQEILAERIHRDLGVGKEGQIWLYQSSSPP